MRQWIGSSLVQIMACHLFSAKPLSKPMLVYVNWTRRSKHHWNFNQNAKLFIHENTSENIVCKMAAILSRGRWVKDGSKGQLPLPLSTCQAWWQLCYNDRDRFQQYLSSWILLEIPWLWMSSYQIKRIGYSLCGKALNVFPHWEMSSCLLMIFVKMNELGS